MSVRGRGDYCTFVILTHTHLMAVAPLLGMRDGEWLLKYKSLELSGVYWSIKGDVMVVVRKNDKL